MTVILAEIHFFSELVTRGQLCIVAILAFLFESFKQLTKITFSNMIPTLLPRKMTVSFSQKLTYTTLSEYLCSIPYKYLNVYYTSTVKKKKMMMTHPPSIQPKANAEQQKQTLHTLLLTSFFLFCTHTATCHILSYATHTLTHQVIAITITHFPCFLTHDHIYYSLTMNGNNNNNATSMWDLEFEGLLTKDGCVNIPISLSQWENNVLALNINTKHLVLQPTLEKIWSSLRGNLTTRLKTWIKINNTLPTPRVVIEQAKKMNCVKNYEYLLQTSPYIIKRVANKINNTLHKQQPLCSQRMEYHHFTDRQDVLQCLQQHCKQTLHNHEPDTMQRSVHYNNAPTPNNPMIPNVEIGHMTGISGIALGDNNSNISNHMTVNINHFEQTTMLMNEPVGSFSMSPDGECPSAIGKKRSRDD